MNVMGGGVGASRVAGPRTAPDEMLLGMGVRSSGADDYRGSHRPPDRDYGASLDNLTALIPEDVYGPAGPRLYGIGDPEIDKEAFNSLRAVRGKPDAEVTVYRAVPENVSTINEGDWVTTSRKYADLHGERTLDGNYKIIEQKAKAKDLFSEGYPYEFGYSPLDMSQAARMQRAAEQGFDTNRTLYHGTSSSFDEMTPSTTGDLGAGNYLTPNPERASSYAAIRKYMRKSTNNASPNVMPLYVKKDLNYLDLQGKGILPFDSSRIEKLKDAGYDAIRQFDDDGNIIQINVFDPANIRSVNAAFDPTKRGSANLGYAKGGLASKSNVERVNNDNRRYLG
jgi:hypothetical protein